MRRTNSAWARFKTRMKTGAAALALGATVLSGGCGTVNHYFSSRPPITDETRETRLIRKLRQSSVLIRTGEGQGSGIIIEQNDQRTVILTNRHVVDPESSGQYPSDIEVNNDSRSFSPESIMVAPRGIDLAVVVLEGSVGPHIWVSDRSPVVGTSIYVVGSPLGNEDSVSAGLISNLRTTRTESGFEFSAIQTDAAVNPGNSGGGIFHAESGELLGIVSFKIRMSPFETAEGMAYAIPISVFHRFPYSEWQTLTRESG